MQPELGETDTLGDIVLDNFRLSPSQLVSSQERFSFSWHLYLKFQDVPSVLAHMSIFGTGIVTRRVRTLASSVSHVCLGSGTLNRQPHQNHIERGKGSLQKKGSFCQQKGKSVLGRQLFCQRFPEVFMPFCFLFSLRIQFIISAPFPLAPASSMIIVLWQIVLNYNWIKLRCKHQWVKRRAL